MDYMFMFTYMYITYITCMYDMFTHPETFGPSVNSKNLPFFQAGYEQLITRMHGQIPKMTSDGTRLQMIVCSATLHDFDVKRLAERLMHFPAWVDLKGQDTVPETVHHVVVHVDPAADTSWQGSHMIGKDHLTASNHPQSPLAKSP